MKKWIINADDFGYSKGVNYGIIEAHQNGIVTSATLMVNMPGAEHAVKLAKENPTLGVGIHLVLTCGRPVRDDVPTLVNEKGEFHRLKDLDKYVSLEDIEREWTSQIEKFFSLGLIPTHLDSHHHVHGHEKIYPIVEKLAKKYALPIRPVKNGKRELHPVQHLCTEFYGDHLSIEKTLDIFDRLLSYETVELMTHPAYIDVELMAGSSYLFERAKELAILTDAAIRSYFADKNIQLATYRDLIK